MAQSAGAGAIESVKFESNPGGSGPPRALVEFFTATLIYGAVAILFFARSLLGSFASRYIGREADPTVMMWLFEWWPYAIGHRINPFLTNLVWAPVGFNLASMTSIPLAAIAAYPLTRSVGVVAAYNVMALLAPVTAALGAFALCRQVSGKFWPSLLGGYLFGFSAYMLGQMLGHLCLVLVFALPLAALLMVARMQGKLGPLSFVILLTFTMAAQFLLDMELFAVGIMFGTAMLAAMVYYSPADERRRYYAELPLLGASLAVAAAALGPYLFFYFAFPQLKQPFWPSEGFSTDLLNFLIPTPANLLGANRWARAISAKFPGRLMERGGYVALPIFVMVFSWARRNWGRPLCKGLVAVLLAGCIATLGPWLHVGGNSFAVLPWLACARMPLSSTSCPRG